MPPPTVVTTSFYSSCSPLSPITVTSLPPRQRRREGDRALFAGSCFSRGCCGDKQVVEAAAAAKEKQRGKPPATTSNKQPRPQQWPPRPPSRPLPHRVVEVSPPPAVPDHRLAGRFHKHDRRPANADRVASARARQARREVGVGWSLFNCDRTAVVLLVPEPYRCFKNKTTPATHIALP